MNKRIHSIKWDSKKWTEITAGVLLLSIGNGCATLSNREKSIVTTLSAGAVGSVVGAVTTPEGTMQSAHAALWGGITAATAGIASLFIFDSEAGKEKLKSANQKLSAELTKFNKETELTPLGSLSEDNDMPAQVRGIIHLGRWNLYQIGEKGQWVKQNEKKYVHQDQLLLYQPGGVSPGAQSQSPSLEENVSPLETPVGERHLLQKKERANEKEGDQK